MMASSRYPSSAHPLLPGGQARHLSPAITLATLHHAGCGINMFQTSRVERQPPGPITFGECGQRGRRRADPDAQGMPTAVPASRNTRLWPAESSAILDQHRSQSGIHTLFDQGYLGVDPKYRLRVSPRLRADFSNGDQFYSRAGQVIAFPERRADRLPSRDFLEWHLDEIFQA